MVKQVFWSFIVSLMVGELLLAGDSMAIDDPCNPPDLDKDFFGLCSEGKWWRYMDNPQLYVRAVADYWEIDSEKVMEKIGWRNLRSLFAKEMPYAYNVGTSVELFKNDDCRKRYLCKMNEYFTEHRSEFSEKTLRELERVDEYFQDCDNYETRFYKCDPQLKDSFAEMDINYQ